MVFVLVLRKSYLDLSSFSSSWLFREEIEDGEREDRDPEDRLLKEQAGDIFQEKDGVA